MTQHLHTDADQHSLLTPHRMASIGAQRLDEIRQHSVDDGQGQHGQRNPDIVGQHRRQKHRAHRHVDNEHQELAGQVLGDPVDGGDPVGQVADQPVLEELHRQAQQPRQAAVEADHRDADRQTVQETVLEQGKDVNQDAGAKKGRHQSPPGPVVCQNVVHENTDACGNDQGQQRQHQSAGNRPGNHAPRARAPGGQLPQQAWSLAARAEIRRTLESQGNVAVALVELFGGNRAAPGSGIVEVEIVSVEPFKNEEMVKLPEQDQRQLHLLERRAGQAQSAALETVVLGGAQDACGAGAVAAHLAFFAQFGKRGPAPEIRQDAAKAGSAAFGCVHLQQKRSGDPAFYGFRCGSLIGGARRHFRIASVRKMRAGTVCRVRSRSGRPAHRRKGIPGPRRG